MAFIRQQMMAGDPFTGGALQTRRKGAGAGTKAKAARHRLIRNRRMMGDPFGGMVPGTFSGVKPPAAKANFDFMGALSKLKSGFGNFAKSAAPVAKAALPFFGPLAAGAAALIPSGGAGTVSSGALASLQRRGAAPTGFGAMPSMRDLGIADVVGGGGGKRRTMNPLNVKALKRSARRFEGFARAIKTVNRALPSGMKFHPPAVGTSSKGRGRRKR